MAAGTVAFIAVFAIVAVICVAMMCVRHVLEEKNRTLDGNMVLVHRLLDAIDSGHREEVENLLSVGGLKPDPVVAEDHQRQLLEQIMRGGNVAQETDQEAGIQEPQRRSQWVFPDEPDPATFEDPTDLTNPLDQIDHLLPALGGLVPDAVAPDGAQWGPDQPDTYVEPVPELERGARQGLSFFSPGENPLEDIGIKTTWEDD